jgi:TRAP-type C4-dicarboxylate transport system substrate-binding protein
MKIIITKKFALVLCLFGLSAAAEPIRIDLATILPRGLGQELLLKQLEQDWAKASGGTVILRTAPGGQKDGEARIVNKLRSGNYQAAMLSAFGLSEIEPDVSALQNMPLVFENWDEVDFVREKIGGKLEAKLRAKKPVGFVVLFWADAGWVNYFSTKPATTPDDFKRLKMFAWAGDSAQMEIMKSLGYQPVALETSDIHQSFATGMIQSAPLTTAFALGVQVPTVAPYVVDVKWAPIVGAAIVREDTWNKIPADLQKKLQALCDSTGVAIRKEGRRFHEDALNTLRKGPKTHVHTLTAAEHAEWQKLGLELAPKIRGKMVPEAIYDDVQRELKEFRASRTAK